MMAHCLLHRQIAEDVAVINNEGLQPEQVLHVFNPPTGFEQDFFVTEKDRHIPVIISWKGLRVSFRAVVRVDGKIRDTRANQMIKRKSDQRLVANRDERLRPAGGQQLQARAEAGTEHEGIFEGEVHLEIAEKLHLVKFYRLFKRNRYTSQHYG